MSCFRYFECNLFMLAVVGEMRIIPQHRKAQQRKKSTIVDCTQQLYRKTTVALKQSQKCMYVYPCLEKRGNNSSVLQRKLMHAQREKFALVSFTFCAFKFNFLMTVRFELINRILDRFIICSTSAACNRSEKHRYCSDPLVPTCLTSGTLIVYFPSFFYNGVHLRQRNIETQYKVYTRGP